MAGRVLGFRFFLHDAGRVLGFTVFVHDAKANRLALKYGACWGAGGGQDVPRYRVLGF